MKKSNISRLLAVGGAAAVLVTVGGVGAATAAHLVTSADIKDGTIRQADINPNALSSFQTPGPKGATGATGAKGTTGAPGKNGTDGKDGVGAKALPYGVALVKVSRGGAAAANWATYSTTLGGPAGDTTGGTFRFTCSAAKAPCNVSVAGYATTDGVKVYPRVDIAKQDFNSGAPMGNCEYGDGTTNSATSSDTLSTDSASPTAMTLGIGGTDDCGLNGPAGTVNQITVPAGFYDVTSTFQFAS